MRTIHLDAQTPVILSRRYGMMKVWVVTAVT